MVFEGNADMVVLQGTSGEMGILPKHAPLLSTLGYGVLKVRLHNQEQVFSIAGGVVEVQPDIITVLADAAENVEEIDVSRAQAAKQRAEEMLKQGPPVGSDAYEAIESALRRSKLRLDAAQRYRRSVHAPKPGGHEMESH